MGALIGFIVFVGIMIFFGSVAQEIMRGWADSFDDFIFEAEREGISFISSIKAFFVMIPVSFIVFNGLVLFVALGSGTLGYAFAQPWGFSTIYDWFEGFFSPAYVRWMLGTHLLVWIGTILDLRKPRTSR
jgi:hypothetical protein